MAKLVFPSVNAPYRGFMGEVRGWLNRTASWLQNSPGGKSTVEAQIKAFGEQTGLDLNTPLPETQAVVTDGETITTTSPAGTVTLTVAAGVVSAAFEAA